MKTKTGNNAKHTTQLWDPTYFELWVMETELWVMETENPNNPLISKIECSHPS